jgi:mono/diheme cytochrome c family protein
MVRNTRTWMGLGCLLLALAGCWQEEDAGTPVATGTEVPDAVGARVISLDQGWSEELQQKFWFTSQGSRILRYEWFMALEQARSNELFRSDANMDRLRYSPDKPSALNPDGLPVGFAVDRDAHSGRRYVGWTCAACHSSQIEYKGTTMRINGGPTLSDSQQFLWDLVEALQTTLADEAKFARFARKVLGDQSTAGAAQELRAQVSKRTAQLAERNLHDRSESPDGKYGFARLDAFGGIFNQVLAADLGLPENYRQGNAPVSYPFIWDSSQQDLVQWNGLLFNAGPGPLIRNVGEVLGVFAEIEVDPKNFPRGYKSSVNVKGLGELETWVDGLWSPQWPAEVLPALDPAKVDRGRSLYQENCQSCHQLIDRTSPKRRITVVMKPVAEVGTDPAMATNAANRFGHTGPLQGQRRMYLLGPKLQAEDTGKNILEHVAIGTIVAHLGEAGKAIAEEYVNVKFASSPIALSYKARSLNGIWATAPYLHNGSVPSLWALLQPEEQRPKEFYVGSREIDPVNVGLVTDNYPGAFRFDTTVPGNSNSGHTYGTTLTDAEKWDLVEYLKSL